MSASAASARARATRTPTPITLTKLYSRLWLLRCLLRIMKIVRCFVNPLRRSFTSFRGNLENRFLNSKRYSGLQEISDYNCNLTRFLLVLDDTMTECYSLVVNTSHIAQDLVQYERVKPKGGGPLVTNP